MKLHILYTAQGRIPLTANTLTEAVKTVTSLVIDRNYPEPRYLESPAHGIIAFNVCYYHQLAKGLITEDDLVAKLRPASLRWYLVILFADFSAFPSIQAEITKQIAIPFTTANIYFQQQQPNRSPNCETYRMYCAGMPTDTLLIIHDDNHLEII